nr:MAG TPA: hypothetical protein [Caudoviricetes sp.]
MRKNQKWKNQKPKSQEALYSFGNTIKVVFRRHSRRLKKLALYPIQTFLKCCMLKTFVGRLKVELPMVVLLNK